MRHRIHLELEIDFGSVWHTGSGESSFMINRLIRRDARNRPFVPASTLKGIVRQNCEKLSRTLGYAEPSNPHQANLIESSGFLPFEQIASPIDRLFGNNYFMGGLFFRDAHIKSLQGLAISARNRVALSRGLRTAKEKHLFSTEYASPAIFQTAIDGWHSDLAIFDEAYPPYAYCLFIAGILTVERIGGDKSTGSGWLNGPISITKVIYNDVGVNMEDIFELLDSKDYREMRGE